MKEFGTYSCILKDELQSFTVTCDICSDAIVFTGAQKHRRLDFSDLQDFRLQSYHIILSTSSGTLELSQLGRETEPFFENLWNAYAIRSKEALFIYGTPLYIGEGDYTFVEQGVMQHGIAKVELHNDALFLCPHDRLARRIPLCFTQEISADDFGISLTLDTGDTYSVRRIGRDAQPVFEKMCSVRKLVSKQWQKAHLELANTLQRQLGERSTEYQYIVDCGCKMITGLYRLNGDGFWFAGLKNGRAVVELVTEEQTATYLYAYNTDDDIFERFLRHAMESVGLHREVIFADLTDKPLYRMTVERSFYLRFLREHNQKRIIHNVSWQNNIQRFL